MDAFVCIFFCGDNRVVIISFIFIRKVLKKLYVNFLYKTYEIANLIFKSKFKVLKR